MATDAIEVAGGTLGEINFAATAAIGFLNPLALQIDAFIGVSLGPLQADLSAQLSGALSAAASLSLNVSNPILSLQIALSALAQLQVMLAAAIAAGASLALPSVSVGFSLSATLSLALALEVKLGLLDIAIKALLRIKIPAIAFVANASLALSAGPAILVEFEGATLADAGTEIASLFAAGVSYNGDTINPTDPVFGYVLVTKDSVAKAGMDYVFQGL